MLRWQLQTVGSGALRCRTPPPARHRARCEALTASLSSPRTTWDAGEARSCFPARKLSCARKGPNTLPAMGYVDSRNLARAEGFAASLAPLTLFSYWRHNRTNRGNVVAE